MLQHLGNGSVKINNKRYQINWTGEIAQHVTENYIENVGGVHTILHLEIQKALQRAKDFFKIGKNTYAAAFVDGEYINVVYFVKSSNFATIKTGYRVKSDIDKFKKGKNYE